MLCPLLVSGSLSVHTSPSHMIKHGKFIFGTHMHLFPLYMHNKYLVILTYSFWLIWFINQRALRNHVLSVMHHCYWHCCHPVSSVHTSPGTGLDIETSYLVHIHAHQIFRDSDIAFKWQPFW